MPSPSKFSSEGLVGSWSTDGPGGRSGTIRFDENGNFRGTGLPSKVFVSPNSAGFGGPPDWNKVEDISGGWAIREDRASNQIFVVVDIRGRLNGAKFEVKEQDGVATLEYPVGYRDGESVLQFRRK
ncbi:hypothetical protein [Arthrobacter sp. RCC_34]|uniref:hypothetical protein n=1 Tax=Arthrobacter sp. RCC_34 TaxID=3239230 RepID=UPI0035231C01